MCWRVHSLRVEGHLALLLHGRALVNALEDVELYQFLGRLAPGWVESGLGGGDVDETCRRAFVFRFDFVLLNCLNQVLKTAFMRHSPGR